MMMDDDEKKRIIMFLFSRIHGVLHISIRTGIVRGTEGS